MPIFKTARIVPKRFAGIPSSASTYDLTSYSAGTIIAPYEIGLDTSNETFVVNFGGNVVSFYPTGNTVTYYPFTGSTDFVPLSGGTMFGDLQMSSSTNIWLYSGNSSEGQIKWKTSSYIDFYQPNDTIILQSQGFIAACNASPVVTADYSAIMANYASSIDSNYSFIGGGYSHTIADNCLYSAILGGTNNSITGASDYYGSIISGYYSELYDSNLSVLVGAEQTTFTSSDNCGGFSIRNGSIADSDYSVLVGGNSNTMNSNNSCAIIGGNGNSFTGSQNSVMIACAAESAADLENTLYTEKIRHTGLASKPTIRTNGNSTYTASTDDHIVIYNTSASNAGSLTLPESPLEGSRLVVKLIYKASTPPTLTVYPQGSDSIEGSGSKSVTTGYTIEFIYDGSSTWYILSNTTSS